jgi:2-C-methyl-D-erythritol 4-phosphate cytidylyltransferase/2-C-methyl-D-erythritol 2,4-cyclodiphosphate synthase
MYRDKRIAVIVAAAGSGTRMGSGISKQYIEIGSEMVLEKALRAFGDHPFIDDIYLVVKKEDMEFCRNEFIEEKGIPKIRAILSGGKHRQASVYNGLRIICQLDGDEDKPAREISIPDFVLVHDGARPFVSDDEISRLVKATVELGAATLGVPVKDTIAKVENLRIKEGLDRSLLYSIQTPQGFQFSKLLDAHKQAARVEFIGTDDAGLVQRLGYDVALVPGSYSNIKITTGEDLQFARAIVASMQESVTAENISTPGWRMGTGFDVHAFAPNRQLVLGGVHIPWEFGLQGHSDADVLTHAIMTEMKTNIAQILEIECEKINIKGTTTEGLGFCGRGEGIAVMASAAVHRRISIK